LTMEYRVARIPKGSGRFREIYIATEEDNSRLRNLIPELESIFVSLDTCNVSYAFHRGKNCVLNALQHIGYRYTLSMDIENFFDSISYPHVKDLIPRRIVDQCFIDGGPKQGLPTSPIIANIAFLKCDKKIVDTLRKLRISAVYTRYADDLIFSFNEKENDGKIRFVAQKILEERLFKINHQKTKLQDAKNGRVVITGIAVDNKGLYATRRTKRKIRAAAHQNNQDALVGLSDWAKCKLPLAI
jgi:RNA-directed DNA polymerase